MNKLCELKDCTGCNACYNVCNHNAIQITENDEGFNYPIIDNNKCVSCGLCTKVCPQLMEQKDLCNDIKKCYAGFSLDNKIRCSSSSGGIFSIIANHIIENNGIVIGAYLNENGDLSHIAISKKEDLSLLQGSKYFQSNIGKIFKRVKMELKQDRYVLFCGTPCQVAGLKSYLQKSNTSKLLLCDFVCHGVPSRLTFKKMRQECNIKEKIYFRNIKGWSIGFYLRSKILCGTVLKPLNGKESFYFKAYLSGYMNRECCYQCHYTNSRRVGDITLADYWGIKERTPLTQKKMSMGVSFIGVNTTKGETFLNRIKPDLFLQERNLDEAMKNNAQFIHPAERPKERNTFYQNLLSKSWDELIVLYHYNPPKITITNKLQILKNMILSFRIK